MKIRNMCAAGIAACLIALDLGAASFPRRDLKQLAQGAAMIVHGRVVRQWCSWDPEHRFIWTHSQVAVREVLKGGPYETVTISEPGGAVGPLNMVVSGAVRFTGGEDVVVFLRDTPLHYWRVYGWGQGKYRVADPAGPEVTAFKARLRKALR